MKTLIFTFGTLLVLLGCQKVSEPKPQIPSQPTTTSLALTANSTAARVDRPVIRSANLEVAEGDDMNPVVALKVSLNKAAHVPVGVSYQTIPSTAVSSVHFEPIRGRLVFKPGETFKHVEIQVFSDRIANGDRHFFLQLSSPSNADLSADGKYRIDIKDDITDTPAVMGVAVSANLAADSFVSIGSGDGAAQLKNVAIEKLRYISIRFSTNVGISRDDLSIRNSVKGKSYHTTEDFYYDTDTHVATWEIFPPITADRLNLVLNASHIKAVLSGVSLDGTWENPLDYDDLQNGSDFPSGGAGAGSDFEFRINVLACDLDQSDTVNEADINILAEKIQAAYEASLDIDQDGTLDEGDLQTCKELIGHSLSTDSL